MQGEQVEILNDLGEVIGVMDRAEAERLNHPLKTVVVFIFRNSGELWIQKRAGPEIKRHYPNSWDATACGAVGAGESFEDAASRELLEEAGLRTAITKVDEFISKFDSGEGEERIRLTAIFVGLSVDQPQVQNEEVTEFRCGFPEDIICEFELNPELFVPSLVEEVRRAKSGYDQLQAN